MTYLDTHVVAWLYANRVDLLSRFVRETIDSEEIFVSPMVLLELDYLKETGRISTGGRAVYENLHSRIGLRICPLAFSHIVDAASAQTWTRDPFDRIIVGHAAAANRDLATCDDTIREHYPRALW
jgi:PIN domain nuclease of toxin-antitoxin system